MEVKGNEDQVLEIPHFEPSTSTLSRCCLSSSLLSFSLLSAFALSNILSTSKTSELTWSPWSILQLTVVVKLWLRNGNASVHGPVPLCLVNFDQPTLIQGPNVLSTGADFTSNGPLISAIA